MRLTSSLVLAASALVSSTIAHASYGPSGSTTTSQITFTNTNRFLFDVDGNQIDAYGSKINYFNRTYYLYGNSFSIEGVAYGIKSYSSPDLVNWEYEGFLFDPTANNPCAASGGCGRPHILYNNQSSTYVLWANAGPSGYQVATSALPNGPFKFLSSTSAIDPQFDDYQPADFTLELIDGTAYLVFSALTFTDPRAGSIWPPIFQTLHISKLTSDFLNTTRVSYPVKSPQFDLIDEEAESPDLFKRGDYFYVSASNTCGYCNGSIGLLYRSKTIQGPWTRQIIAGYSCEGQVEGVLPLTNPSNGQVSYVWHSTSVPGGPRTGFGGHIFQPLNFNADGSVQDLDCSTSAKFPVKFQRGIQATPSGSATTAGDKSPLIAPYNAVCDSDSFDLYQTWTAGKSGTLKSVSVNVAKSVQTVPLSLTVFKFSSYNDLASPEYKWTTLGSASYNASKLTFVFNMAIVNVTQNATVTKGDLLGLAFTGADFAPYCHLEYPTSAQSSNVLLQRGAGQNSWRGNAGRTSILYERVGKSIKFFANYA